MCGAMASSRPSSRLTLAIAGEPRDRGGVRPRPFVTVHLAQSLDGRVALDGVATPLSTAAGRACAHAARAAHDAVLVGSSTVRIDNPRLTVREAPGSDPLRVVLASTFALPRGAQVLSACRQGARDRRRGARSRRGARRRSRPQASPSPSPSVMPTGASRSTVRSTCSAARGVERLLVEGGAKVVTSFLRARRVDRLSIEIAMRLLGAPGTAMLGLARRGCARAGALAHQRVGRATRRQRARARRRCLRVSARSGSWGRVGWSSARSPCVRPDRARSWCERSRRA